MNELPLRPNVCLLIFNKDKKLFLGERLGEPSHWQFPQGGVEEEYSLEKNALREAAEELGVKSDSLRIIKRLEATHQYEFDCVPEYARGVWRGQKQTFWLLEFTGSDSEIDLERNEPEFMNWRWCSIEAVKQLAEPKRLPGYNSPLNEFHSFLKGLA